MGKYSQYPIIVSDYGQWNSPITNNMKTEKNDIEEAG